MAPIPAHDAAARRCTHRRRIDVGAHANAITHLQQALAIRLQLLGESSGETATSANNLGSAYRAIGDFERATPLFEKDTFIMERVVGHNHLLTAKAAVNLATCYASRLEFAKAVSLYEQAAAVQDNAGDSGKDDLIDTLGFLSIALRSQGAFGPIPAET